MALAKHTFNISRLNGNTIFALAVACVISARIKAPGLSGTAFKSVANHIEIHQAALAKRKFNISNLKSNTICTLAFARVRCLPK